MCVYIFHFKLYLCCVVLFADPNCVQSEPAPVHPATLRYRQGRVFFYSVLSTCLLSIASLLTDIPLKTALSGITGHFFEYSVPPEANSLLLQHRHPSTPPPLRVSPAKLLTRLCSLRKQSSIGLVSKLRGICFVMPIGSISMMLSERSTQKCDYLLLPLSLTDVSVCLLLILFKKSLFWICHKTNSGKRAKINEIWLCGATLLTAAAGRRLSWIKDGG